MKGSEWARVLPMTRGYNVAKSFHCSPLGAEGLNGQRGVSRECREGEDFYPAIAAASSSAD